jgi:Nuclease-related domain
MARPHPTPPEPDGSWPTCDQEQPGISIRPLSHGDLQALLAHLHHHDRHRHRHQSENRLAGPRAALGASVVAVRVRASVGLPGAAAQTEYRRRRAMERSTWTRGLVWRAPLSAAAGLAASVVATQAGLARAGLVGLVVATVVGWWLRFRPSANTRAWRRGATGERRTARLLAPLERRGWAVLHDLAIPGSPANIDHLVIGPGGVLVIDSKQYRGRLRLDSHGMLWHGRHLLVSTLRTTRWAADQADELLGIADLQVPAIVAVHGASIPWGRVHADGTTVVPARQLANLLQALPPILGPERVAWLADRARLRFHPAA